MNGFTIIVVSVCMLIPLGLKIKRTKDPLNDADTYIQEEITAHQTPDKEIDPSIFVHFEEEHFPFTQSGILKERPKDPILLKENIVRKKINQPMVYFAEPLSNRDIKLTYGAANLNKIIIYEEHFNSFMHSLYKWAHELYKAGKLEEAKIILENAVKQQANISQIYVLLIDIYMTTEKNSKAQNLLDIIEHSSLTASIKRNLQSYMHMKLKINI